MLYCPDAELWGGMALAVPHQRLVGASPFHNSTKKIAKIQSGQIIIFTTSGLEKAKMAPAANNEIRKVKILNVINKTSFSGLKINSIVVPTTIKTQINNKNFVILLFSLFFLMEFSIKV